VRGNVRCAALLHYLSWTDSIKPILQFSFEYCCFQNFRGIFFFPDLFFMNQYLIELKICIPLKPLHRRVWVFSHNIAFNEHIQSSLICNCQQITICFVVIFFHRMFPFQVFGILVYICRQTILPEQINVKCLYRKCIILLSDINTMYNVYKIIHD
jgi:hypothetical protein